MSVSESYWKRWFSQANEGEIIPFPLDDNTENKLIEKLSFSI
jgi:hypothetical protein